MTTLPIYYALWYYSCNGEKSANAISDVKDDLWDLHKKALNNPDCYYHKYKKSIFKVEVLPIQIYIYNNNNTFTSFTSLKNDFKIEETFEFYSSYNYYLMGDENEITNNNCLEEILIYMSKDDHQKWRVKLEENENENKNNNNNNNKNIISMSLNPVKINEYYEEGIMNA